jgi:hypothetical protein
MIEISACHVLWVHQGGCCMFPFSSSHQEQGTLAQIWSQLSADLQTRVIGLVAQLALNVVIVQSQSQPQREEICHAEQAADPQNPS